MLIATGIFTDAVLGTSGAVCPVSTWPFISGTTGYAGLVGDHNVQRVFDSDLDRQEDRGRSRLRAEPAPGSWAIKKIPAAAEHKNFAADRLGRVGQQSIFDFHFSDLPTRAHHSQYAATVSVNLPRKSGQFGFGGRLRVENAHNILRHEAAEQFLSRRTVEFARLTADLGASLEHRKLERPC